MHIAPVNGTAKSAGRENARQAPDKAERPRSLGPARVAARREGPRTAANRTGGSNPARFLCYIKDLLAEGVGPSSIDDLLVSKSVYLPKT